MEMREGLEVCRWWPEGGPMPDTGRLYLGHEGCRRIFLEKLPRRVEWLVRLRRTFSVVVPFLTPGDEETFLRLLAELPLEAEVVVNDVGAFLLAAEAGHAPVLGRLLSRQHTDPAIATFNREIPDRIVYTPDAPARLSHRPPPESLQALWRTPPIFSGAALDIFRGYLPGLPLRVEIDHPPQGLPSEGPEALVTLHCGEAILSVKPCRKCAYCAPGPVQASHTRTGTPTHWRRNLYLYPTEMPETLPDYVDRVVLG